MMPSLDDASFGFMPVLGLCRLWAVPVLGTAIYKVGSSPGVSEPPGEVGESVVDGAGFG